MGSIDGHKIVLACLPLTGKGSAAITATHRNSTFLNLKIRLIVDIGGSIPCSGFDIRLNYKNKSTKGLSLLFFMLAMTGNLTYAVVFSPILLEKNICIPISPGFWVL